MQPNGTTVTPLTADLMAKNLTSEPLNLVKVRLVRPQIVREIVSEHVDANDRRAAVIAPRRPCRLFIHVAVRRAPKQKQGHLNAVIALADNEGHEQRVKL